MPRIKRYKIPHVPIDGTLYIAGPMTGHPAFNIPAFDDAAERLRAVGYEVASPAELDRPAIRRAQELSPDGDPSVYENLGETWADFLSRDVKLIGDSIAAVAVLPGWETSKGARLEAFVARLSGLPVYAYEEPMLVCPADGGSFFTPPRLRRLSPDELNSAFAQEAE